MICSKNIFWLLYLNILTLCVDAEEMLKEISPGYYDDVITDGLKADPETGVSLILQHHRIYFYIKILQYVEDRYFRFVLNVMNV